MICELQIKLGNGKTPLLYHSNQFLHEIIRACNCQNRYRLFEVYTKAANYPAGHGRTIDSVLVK